MESRAPVVLITGPLGSGKTTLLQYLLQTVSKRIAILMNEFGEISIDSKTIEGKNVRMAELGGGCVCCSLIGEFEAAVNEVIDTVEPELILVETTGLAEPDALIFNIQESLCRTRLDGVIAVADADAMVRYPHLGHTAHMQLEAADIILLNKSDLVSEEALQTVRQKLASINEGAPSLTAQRCTVDPNLLLGSSRQRDAEPPTHIHHPEFHSFTYSSLKAFDRKCFEEFLNRLHPSVYRAKGFVRFPQESRLFNYVAGRWDLEPFAEEKTTLVFIGRDLDNAKSEILDELRRCER